MRFRHRTVQRWYAMSVWVNRRVSQFLSKPPLEDLRDEVLKTFRFIVEFFEGIAEFLKEKGFNQPVVPDDFERPLATVIGQTSSTVTLIDHQGRISQRQLLDHVRYRSIGDTEPFSDGAAAHLLRAIMPEVKDHLKVVIDGFRVRFVLAAVSHSQVPLTCRMILA